MAGARFESAAPGGSGRVSAVRQFALILFFTRLLAGPLACQCCLDSLFLAGLQVKGMSFDFLDNVFLLHLALEAA